MFKSVVQQKPTFWEAFSIVLIIVTIIALSIGQLGATPHIPILFVTFLLIGYGLLKSVPYKTLESSMIAGASSGIGAVYIFLGIGLLISSWIVGGTIPTLLYFGLTIVSASFFYVIVFVITAIIGTAIGSSLTTVATLGVAFISIATAIDASLAITAGAIVSGAFFGDKMSPLSDTTNLAASIVGVDLFEHIKNMSWTTVPAFIMSALIYAILSPSASDFDAPVIESYKESLLATNLVHWYAVVPLLVLIICTFSKYLPC